MSDDWVWTHRRYNDREVSEMIDDLRPLAKEYLWGYEGENEFLCSLQEHIHALSVRQVRGVVNWMRLDSRGRRILERGPKELLPPKEEPVRPPRDRTCPYLGTEHDAHFFPLDDKGIWSQHCRGWHFLTRKPVTTRARFAKDYVRGSKSNVIHRSTHVGTVTWYPERWHQPGPVYPAYWTVGRRCTPGASPLRNPVMLTADEVWTAEPVEVSASIKIKDITLCRLCFPGTCGEVIQRRQNQSS